MDQSSSTRSRAFYDGIVRTLPFMAGTMPFALIYGILGSSVGLSVLETMCLSLFVFSGAAQFVALSLIAVGTPIWVIWVVTLILNIRHILYAATLSPYIRHLSLPWRFLLSVFLTDETFATMESYYRQSPSSPHSQWVFWGSCVGLYVNWHCWVFVAAFVGQKFSALSHSGLEFGAIAAFIGIVVPRLKEKPAFVAAVVSGVIAVLCARLPYNLNLTLAALGGILAGTLTARKRTPQTATELS